MTRIVAALADISADYDTLFCDIWGCLHDGVRAFPDAVAALRGFRDRGGRVFLLTNAPRPRGQVAAQLAQLGAPDDCYDDIVTSGDSAQAALVRGVVGRRVYHMGPEKDLTFFTELPDDLPPSDIELVPLDQAEGVACTGLMDDENEHPDDYRPQLLLAKTRGLKLLCANPDIVVDKGHTRLWCAGAIAKLYTEMGGQSLYFGKPHPPIYDLARRRFAAMDPGAEPRILCVGDGPGTDLAGAIGEGLDVLFVTGGIVASQTGTGGAIADQPDPERLDAYLAGEKMTVTYAIGRLR
jgi:HAD superfamily hydrolase (TIGR01459 family)